MTVVRPHRTRMSDLAVLVLTAAATVMVALVAAFVLTGIDAESVHAPGRLPPPPPIDGTR